MLPYIGGNGKIYAFEPFEGNYRFFHNIDPRIIHFKQALYFQNCTRQFYVHSTISQNQAWGAKGYTGYSSLGYIVESDNDRAQNKCWTVECVAADDVIPQNVEINFVKLDLQGGELNALKGMERIQKKVFWMWIEFTDQKALLEYLEDRGYMLYETPWLFLPPNGDPGIYQGAFEKDFKIYRTATLSTDATAYFAHHLRSWPVNFHDQFQEFRRKYGLVQTDLICIPEKNVDIFAQAINFV